jgi:putative NADPH-quinone reductase
LAISLILAHPDPHSLNHAIAAVAAETLRADGYAVTIHGLYAEGFDPLLPAGESARGATLPPLVAQHCAEIATAEGIVIVHPNWWGQPPAILKGWVDRVLRAGVAYEFLEGDSGEGVPRGLLVARAALVFNTSNTPHARELSAFGDPLQALWRDCIFGLCGVNAFERRMFGVVVTSSPAQRATWLDEVRAMVRHHFPGR